MSVLHPSSTDLSNKPLFTRQGLDDRLQDFRTRGTFYQYMCFVERANVHKTCQLMPVGNGTATGGAPGNSARDCETRLEKTRSEKDEALESLAIRVK